MKSKGELSQSIYLPEKYRFEQTGVCGSSGTLHVWQNLSR